MKKALLVAAIITLIIGGIFAGGKQEAGSAGGSSSKEQIKVVYTTMTLGAPYFVEVGNGMKAAGEKLGWSVQVHDPKGDIAAQVSAMENFVAQGIDLIFLSALDGNAVKDVVAKANEAGIPVVTEATIVEGSTAHIGPGEENMGLTLGRGMGQWAEKNLTGKIKVATYHVTQDPHTLVREESMRVGLEEFYKDEIEYVASLGGLTPEDGLKNMEGIMQAHPDINIVMGCNDDSIMGSYQAARSAGMDLSVMGFGGVNAIPQALELMKEEKDAGEGAYRVTVDIVPFKTGEICIEVAEQILNDKPFEETTVIPSKAVTWENIDDYF